MESASKQLFLNAAESVDLSRLLFPPHVNVQKPSKTRVFENNEVTTSIIKQHIH